MPHLVIGHTTATTARIWVKGDRFSDNEVRVTLPKNEKGPSRYARLGDYTAVVEFDGLNPDTDYQVCATFMPSNASVHGRLRTFRTTKDSPDAFSFVLSSCNLSVVSITDLMASMVGIAGTHAARTSLDLPFRRWIGPPRLLSWLKPVMRIAGKALVLSAAWLVAKTTNVKQPNVQYLRSPFLKLSAVFESTILRVNLGPRRDCPEYGFLAVGDEVRAGRDVGDLDRPSAPGGIVASISEIRALEPSQKNSPCLRNLVLTQATHAITHGLTLFRRVALGTGRRAWHALGLIEAVSPASPWFSRPSFFLHAGDQIYYDFPDPSRDPNRREYRRAYREAWFEDEPLKHLLAHWPQYMTLDDHELADQFSLDFMPPNVDIATPQPEEACTEPDKASKKENKKGNEQENEKAREKYLTEATEAYRQYVHALAPAEFQNRSSDGPFWYTFSKGSAGFFVLDTRTKRRVERRANVKEDEKPDGEMIDANQLKELLAWLEKPYRPKFIVTSVPFVAELNDRETQDKREWFRNAGNDKWCAPAFKKQRDDIIEAIAKKRIEDIVFLTGDMHCCYHATMRVAVERGRGKKPKKYESITLHELAGGPVNQLQLARIDEFHRRRTGKTGKRDTRSGFMYEVRLEQFHGDVAAVMHIAVAKQRRRDMPDAVEAEPELVWNVIRTLTDPGPDAWPRRDRNGASDWGPNPEPVMGGRIAFTRRRTVKELQPW